MRDRTFSLFLLLFSFALIVVGTEIKNWLFYPGIIFFFLSAHNLGGLDNEANWKDYIKQKREERDERKFLNK